MLYLDNTLHTDLTTGSVSKQLIRFAIPLLIANLLQSLYSVVDMIVVGNFADSAALSAVSIGGQVMMLVTNLGWGLTMGAQVLLAQYAGAKDQEGQLRTIGTTISAVGIISVIFTVVGLLIYEPVIGLLNTPEAAIQPAKEYLIVCLLGIIFIMGYNVVCSVLRALGDSTRPMLFVAIATVVNIVGDLLLVAVFHMGALGAAIATVAAQAVSFIWATIYLYRRRDRFVFDFKKDSFRIMGDKLKMVLKIGIPFAIQFSIINVAVMFIVSLVNEYGVAASAAYGVGGKIDNFAMMPMFAIESASSTMIGQCIGASKKDRVSKVVHMTLLINITVAAVMLVIAQLFPGFFIKIFNQDADVIEYGVKYMRIMSFYYLAFGGMTAFNAVIMGVGNSGLSLFSSVMDGVVLKIGLAALFGKVLGWGYDGILLGNMLSPYICTIIGMVYYFSGMWKKRTLMK